MNQNTLFAIAVVSAFALIGGVSQLPHMMGVNAAPAVKTITEMTSEELMVHHCTYLLKDGFKNPDSFKLHEAHYRGRSNAGKHMPNFIREKYDEDRYVKAIYERILTADSIDLMQVVLIAEGTDSYGAVVRNEFLCDALVPTGEDYETDSIMLTTIGELAS